MYNSLIYILLCNFFLLSCSNELDSLEIALRLAGNNRPELEKVLAHYSQNPADSLKYKSAVFLIENMPEHYANYANGLEIFRDTVKDFTMNNEWPKVALHVQIVSTDLFERKFTVPSFQNFNKIFDIHVITADYLIDNIDLSFRAWQEMPWGASISFMDFCEYILPYRTGNEPLENWRRQYFEKFKPVLDSLMNSDDMIEAGRLLYDTIDNSRWIFDSRTSSIHFGALSLLECRLGDCRLLADYATFIFRSVGIPVGIDCILQNPDMQYQFHYWNYIKDISGNTIPFELYQIAPSHEKGTIKRKKGKVYRIHYNKQEASIALRYKKEKIPHPLNNAFLTDVSIDYFDDNTVEYHTDNIKPSVKLLYVGVFNNRTWIPISCCEIKQGKAVFRNLEPGIAYQALIYQNGQLIPFSVPFITLDDGQPYFLHPDSEKRQTLRVDRKYSMPVWRDMFKHRSVGGLFQGANQSDFSDAVTLFTITHELDMFYHYIPIGNTKQFKYLRYFSARDSHCNMAEIQFFCNGKELTGKVIGTEGSTFHKIEFSMYAVFDKDPVTFFDSLPADSAWVGLDLDHPSSVTAIEYLFRCDDNGVREGDRYELFYFSDNGLVSLGERTGFKNGFFDFEDVPANALYLLRNHTRGREERVFTYEEGKQIFY